MTREEYLALHDQHLKFLKEIEERGKLLCSQSDAVLADYRSGKTDIGRVNKAFKRVEQYYKKESVRLREIKLKILKRKVRDEVEFMLGEKAEKGLSRKEAFQEILLEIPELDDWFPEFLAPEEDAL